jgi:sialate O-acetylesterase
MKTTGMRITVAALLLVMLPLARISASAAELSLPSIFSDHMVLQCGRAVPVWGWADPGEQIVVEFGGQSKSSAANADGKWMVTLDPLVATGTSRELVVSSPMRSRSVKVTDVIVGEVWLGSGQSNAAFEMSRMTDYADEVANANNPTMREYVVTCNLSRIDEQADCPGFWRVVSPGSTKDFSAVGYFFMKSLQTELKTPVAYINNCWPGVRLETYLSSAAIASAPPLAEKARNEKEHFVSRSAAMQQWLKTTGREDPVTEAVGAFTKGPLTPENGWEEPRWIDRKNLVVAGQEPHNGVFWIAAEVKCVASEWSSPKRMLLCNNGLFEKVYWNGELIGETSYRNYLGSGTRWNYFIQPEVVKDGINYLAVRFYAPIEPPGFGWWPSLEGTRLEWRIKKECEFAPLADVNATPRLNSSLGTGSLFNGMIHPVVPYGFRGVVWYQGESNVNTAFDYREDFPLLINDWRQQWQQGDFPFLYCQLANHREKSDKPGESSWAELREAQSMALSVPNTGMAVLIDTGESEDIHPESKDVAGNRLARIALANTYGRLIPYSGPTYDSMNIEGGTIRLTFHHVAGGLVAREVPATYDVMRSANKTASLVRNRPGSQLEGFAICGTEQNWVWADAKIEGDSVVVWSDQVPAPVAVRYGWADNPTCNLYNQAGLPTSPFRTDDFPGTKQPPPRK